MLQRLLGSLISCSLFPFFSSTVPKDPNPQWRRVAWSHDCTLLAFADSTGTVRLFDLMGSELFVIPPVTPPPHKLSLLVFGISASSVGRRVLQRQRVCTLRESTWFSLIPAFSSLASRSSSHSFFTRLPLSCLPSRARLPSL